MKTFLTLITFSLSILLFGQVPAKHDYPDTLWVYGQSTDLDYGLSPAKPIKVGGGILPKHIYRYLNSLIDTNGNNISYERIGTCCSAEIKRSKPLTTFKLNNDKNQQVYFDQYEWEKPKLLNGFQWKESRAGYYGEYENDTIFHGYGLYFFPDGGYYKGNWLDGIMDGEGEMVIPDQEKYVGQLKEGQYHGYGKLYYPDGGKYIGMWSNGEKEGEGKIYYPPGSVIEFIEGSFTNDSPIGSFKVVNSDGSEETHEFE
jgi:hypothetical protein